MVINWLLFDPFMQNVLNVMFGVFLMIGVGLLIFNLLYLVFARRLGCILGVIIGLFIIGICVRWDSFILHVSDFVGQIMGGLTQSIGFYFFQVTYQWLFQNITAATVFLI
ncbi:MAG: hypothetical protein ACETWM_06485 [Candidatus Lokiarchaeia archaeon]